MNTFDLEITLPDGTIVPLMMVEPEQEGGPRTITDLLSAAEADEPITGALDSSVQETWHRGLGLDYNAAYGLITWIPGYVIMGPAATQFGTVVANGVTSPIVAFAEYAGDLWILQAGSAFGGRVSRSTGGSGAFANSAFGGPLAVGEFGRDMLVADDGAGTTVLWVSSSDVNGLNGRMHKYDGAAWTSSAAATFGTNGRNRMAWEYWTTSDGNSAWRIVTISGKNKISYTAPNSDPLLAGSWTEGVKGGSPGTLREIVNFRRHAYFAATDDVYDMNELGELQGITSWLRRMPQSANGAAIEHLNSYIYTAVGHGLVRIYVGGGTLSEDPAEGLCAPGWDTPAEGDWRGQITALYADGGLWCAVYNPTVQKTFIFYGLDHHGALSSVTKNPIAWHGPVVTYNADYKVGRMFINGLAGDLRLWIASHSVGAGNTRLDWVSLPIAGTPLDDLISGGTMKFTVGTDTGQIVGTYSRLESLPDTGGDKAILKLPYMDSIGTRGPLSASTKIHVSTRVDPAPGQTTWTAVGDITASPSQDIAPPSASGHKMQYRLEFFAPSGGATPPVIPVLDSVKRQWWPVVPTFRTIRISVVYGMGVPNEPDRSPDTVTAQLRTATESAQLTVRDRQDRRWTLKFRQILPGGEEWFDAGKRVTKTLTADVISGPLP